MGNPPHPWEWSFPLLCSLPRTHLSSRVVRLRSHGALAIRPVIACYPSAWGCCEEKPGKAVSGAKKSVVPAGRSHTAILANTCLGFLPPARMAWFGPALSVRSKWILLDESVYKDVNEHFSNSCCIQT